MTKPLLKSTIVEYQVMDSKRRVAIDLKEVVAIEEEFTSTQLNPLTKKFESQSFAIIITNRGSYRVNQSYDRVREVWMIYSQWKDEVIGKGCDCK